MGMREIWLNVVVPWKRRRENGNCSPSIVTTAPPPAPTTTPVPATAMVQPFKRYQSKG
jgi:hypothetical protein